MQWLPFREFARWKYPRLRGSSPAPGRGHRDGGAGVSQPDQCFHGQHLSTVEIFQDNLTSRPQFSLVGNKSLPRRESCLPVHGGTGGLPVSLFQFRNPLSQGSRAQRHTETCFQDTDPLRLCCLAPGGQVKGLREMSEIERSFLKQKGPFDTFQKQCP